MASDIRKRNLWITLSSLLIIVGIGFLASRVIHSQPTLNYGIDFIGGSTLILKFDELDKRSKNAKKGTDIRDINVKFISDIRRSLNSINLDKSTIQITQDKEVLIKTNELDNSKINVIQSEFKKQFGNFEVLEIDFIGPTIGAELKSKSLWIILLVTVALLIYITWRFEFSFGIAAIGALIHDALITLSFASILSIEINTIFVAALLTILGYSINDTIVVFDRLRENLNLGKHKGKSITQIANLSLNQTFMRTINTSVTTLLVISCLLIFGGTTIKAFCLVLLIGIISGTYSSVFIAAPIFVGN